MKKDLIIIGAGGHGKVCADIAQQLSKWENIYFMDDDNEEKFHFGYRIIGKTDSITNYINSCDYFVAIGNNNIREHTTTKLESVNASITTLIHPQSIINSKVEIGPGTAIMAGAIINSDTKIGKGVIINTGSTIDHDNLIGDFVHVSPGCNLAGNVSIGSRTWIGIDATILNKVDVNKDSIIGAKSLVLEDIPKPGTYIGMPAKIKNIET